MELINSFYDKKNPYSREVYETSETPEQYKGFLLFTRANTWVDVVEPRTVGDVTKYIVISQRGSVANAKRFIDSK